jgi:hypothetical protein
MVDSRQKGARAEAAAKGLLIKHTGLDWQRTPGSGALNAKHKLKGDLYLPDCKNKFCVEVKHYKDDHFTSKLLTDKNPQLLKWWDQAVRQAEEIERDPLLLFKFDRSKWFVAFNWKALSKDSDFFKSTTPPYKYSLLFLNGSTEEYIAVAKLEDWLAKEQITWIL